MKTLKITIMALLLTMPYINLNANAQEFNNNVTTTSRQRNAAPIAVTTNGEISITFLKDYIDVVIEVFDKDYNLIGIYMSQEIKTNSTVTFDSEIVQDGTPSEISIVSCGVVVYNKKINKKKK